MGEEFSYKVQRFRSSRLPRLRPERNVHWHYRKDAGLNFGDWIGPYLFTKLTGKKPFRISPRHWSQGSSYFICGSILGHIRKANSAIVWGAGAIKEDERFPEPRKIHAVRGPLSREICLMRGYSCPKIYGDPGLLMPIFFPVDANHSRYDMGIIPHYKDLPLFNKLYSDIPGLRVIDVQRPVEDVVREIINCKTTVSTSLHGLIISHAYNVPSAWGVASNLIIGGDFKYHDYFLGAQFNEIPSPLDLSYVWSKTDLIDAALSSPKLPEKWSATKLLDVCPIKSAHLVDLRSAGAQP